jgi:lipoyl-dependent peroxiredoxin subunit D
MTAMTMDEIREGFPEAAKDLKLNLQAVLGDSSLLTAAQKYGVALACAAASRCAPLRDALARLTRTEAGREVEEDAIAAAALMGMNNILYRFRHMIGNDAYGQMPARLRMNRLAKPASNKADFELFALAVSAINGCEACVRAHEKSILEAGLTETHVHEAIRIAATVHGAAIALETALD